MSFRQVNWMTNPNIAERTWDFGEPPFQSDKLLSVQSGELCRTRTRLPEPVIRWKLLRVAAARRRAASSCAKTCGCSARNENWNGPWKPSLVVSFQGNSGSLARKATKRVARKGPSSTGLATSCQAASSRSASSAQNLSQLERPLALVQTVLAYTTPETTDSPFQFRITSAPSILMAGLCAACVSEGIAAH